ncbi:MAG TPA: hypothetical protein ENI51_01025 [Candidatus Atribacteria bacterium]|nr:hypothetical protein [Candidatus Atribacteria bacterium]
MGAIFFLFVAIIFFFLYAIANWIFHFLPWWKWLSAYPVVIAICFLIYVLIMDLIIETKEYFEYLKNENKDDGPEN